MKLSRVQEHTYNAFALLTAILFGVASNSICVAYGVLGVLTCLRILVDIHISKGKNE